MGNIIKIILLIVLIAILALVIGPCVYANFIKKSDIGMPDIPDSNKATHSFYIENTGQLIFASDFEQSGSGVGSRTFILHGFWEMSGNKFKYKNGDIILSEKVFGPITVKRRAK